MEFRWLPTEEQRAQPVESSSLSEILALAQQLQAKGEGTVSEEQVVEMGRELGIQPEYLREALRLRRRPARPLPVETGAPEPATEEGHSLATVARATMLGLGVGTLPFALWALASSDAAAVPLLVLGASLVAGWSARSSRLAGITGTGAAVATTMVAGVFFAAISRHFGSEALIFPLLSFPSLGAAAGRFAARRRREAEHRTGRTGLTASGH
jgi:hypothetical protein